MNADSVVIARNAREEPDYFDVRVLTQRLQRECAVLATAPTEDDLFRQGLALLPSQELPPCVRKCYHAEVARHDRSRRADYGGR